MEDLERRLQLAVVMYIGGARPPVSCADAAAMLAEHLESPRHRFSVHKFHPEDFLVVFTSQELRNKALERPLVLHSGVQLHIKPWLRQALATARCMRIQADVLIEGVPSHAWSRETAAELLGSACLIDSIAPETESREDMSLFKLRVWCVDPDEVPVSRKLWVPEPVSLDPAARRPSFRQLLEYPTLIHIGRLRDFSPPELWRRSSRSDSDSGQSGLPDSSPGSFAGGEWSVQPWTRGIRDQRGMGRYGAGPAAYGVGRSYKQALEGRVGPSDWRIPPMTHAGLGAPPPRAACEAGRTAVGPRRNLVVQAELLDQAILKAPAGESVLVKSASQVAPIGGQADRSVVLGLSDEVQADKSIEGQEGVADATRAADPVPGPVIGSMPAATDVCRLAMLIQDRPMETADPAMAHVASDAAAPLVGGSEEQVVEPMGRDTEGQTGGPLDRLLPPLTAQLVEVGDVVGSASQVSAHQIPSSLEPVGALSTTHAAGWAPISELGGIPEYGQTPRDAPPQVASVEPCMDVTTYVGAPCNSSQTLVVAPHANLEENQVNVTTKELVALGNIKSFCAGLLKKLAPPLLKEIEGARGVRPGQDPFMPRRTTRSVLNPMGTRKTKATVAETVLLKALGVACEDLAVSEDTLGVLRSVFDSPLQEQQLRAIAAIFGKTVPTNLAAQMESAAMTIA
ncbi:hypothetical protein ACQJBY_069091 [Aegilops geniculata]